MKNPTVNSTGRLIVQDNGWVVITTQTNYNCYLKWISQIVTTQLLTLTPVIGPGGHGSDPSKS